jgi:hypothetical protein
MSMPSSATYSQGNGHGGTGDELRGEDVGIWGFKCPVQAAALQDWSMRSGIDWSIPPEQQTDRPPTPPEDKRKFYGPINMMG